MRVGLQVPGFTWSNDQGQLGDTFATIARRAERAGFYAARIIPEVENMEVAGR